MADLTEREKQLECKWLWDHDLQSKPLDFNTASVLIRVLAYRDYTSWALDKILYMGKAKLSSQLASECEDTGVFAQTTEFLQLNVACQSNGQAHHAPHVWLVDSCFHGLTAKSLIPRMISYDSWTNLCWGLESHVMEINVMCTYLMKECLFYIKAIEKPLLYAIFLTLVLKNPLWQMTKYMCWSHWRLHNVICQNCGKFTFSTWGCIGQPSSALWQFLF